MLNFLKTMGDRLKGQAAKFVKDPNFLEGLCAMAAYVGSADGNFDDSELNAAVKIITNNEIIKGAGFQARDIQTVMDRMADKAEGGRSGRSALLKEIHDIAGNPELAEAVLLIGLDIADQGGIDEKEKAALRNVAKELGLDRMLEEQLAA